MRQELWIDGQRVDLSADTSITLEYTSSLFGDVGKLHTPRSYTVKLPRTTVNARILDDPGTPGHESSKARRYLDARYYRNGIDLVGEGQVHILARTDDSYEVALVWDSVPNLAALANSKDSLTAITGLGTYTWKGANVATTPPENVVFFADYFSGVWSGTSVNAAPHPSVLLLLMTTILRQAGVPYVASPAVLEVLKSHALLVAPSHKPSRAMEIASGARSNTLTWLGSRSYWWFTGWTKGWDAVDVAEDLASVPVGASFELRFILSLKITGEQPSNLVIRLEHGGNEFIMRPTVTDDGGYILDQVVDLKDAVGVESETDYFGIYISGLASDGSYTFGRYTSDPMFAIIRPHEVIQTDKDNRFPVADNLPEIGQYEFIKAIMGLFGIAPVIRSNTLYLYTYDEILKTDEALDWTSKVDMTGGDGIREAGFTLAELAQVNTISYEDDVTLPEDPTIVLEVNDETLAEQKERLKLPFAASRGNIAQHYKCRDAWEDDAYYVEVEDIDIKPRIFGFEQTPTGTLGLTFPATLQGQGAVTAYHKRFQDIIRSPRTLEIDARLNEIDLAQLDLSRAVYLAQYGQYYAILKVQTSDTDLCKLELLQIS